MSENRNPHKFKHGGTDGHNHVVYCEYCGYIAFHGQYTKNDPNAIAKTGCKYAPDGQDDA